MKIKNTTVFLITLALGLNLVVLPSFAKIDGGISKNNFYSTDNTIMSEIIPNKTLITEKYWEKNLFYFNKYRPLFMLSSKELYDLLPKEDISVMQRIRTPSVYNISLKTSSVRKISLVSSSPPSRKEYKPTNIVAKNNKPDIKLISKYEQAKNPEIEPEKKLEVVIILKNSKNISNYKLALDLLDDVIKKEPYNAYAFYIKGELYSQQNDFENAMKNYIEALKINPYSKQSCIGIAKILELTNKELAQKYYDRAKISDAGL